MHGATKTHRAGSSGMTTGDNGPRTARPLLSVVRLARLLRAIGLATLTAVMLPESALATGTIAGQVTDQNGPVGGAVVALISQSGASEPHATSAVDGTYSINAPEGSYSLGATPPPGSGDGYFEQGSVAVTSGTTTTVNPVLPPLESTGHLFGTARYADNTPEPGIQIAIDPANPTGPFRGDCAVTDANGNWDAGQIPAGTYDLVFIADVNNSNFTEASRYVTVGEGAQASVTTTLEGAHPEFPESCTTGTGVSLEGTVTTVDGIPVTACGCVTITSLSQSGNPTYADTNAEGRFTAAVPAGNYSVTIAGGGEYDTEQATASITITPGQTAKLAFVLPPLPVPPGTSAAPATQLVSFLNAQRAQWGLPAGIGQVASWSQACAAHDVWMRASHQVTHYEGLSIPGVSSPGGAWAAAHSILSGYGPWTSQVNPWEDAPIHLDQLMAPGLSAVGIDSAYGYSCTTTWPGMLRAPMPPGTVLTYPGDGTSGLPPAEWANELPEVPGQQFGITGLAGRELFVYEEGVSGRLDHTVSIASASLTSPRGPNQVKWADASSDVGGYLPGAIVIPVAPLAPYTTYTATVSLNANPLVGLSPITHQWSFTTGAPNPSGSWPGLNNSGVINDIVPPRILEAFLTHTRFRVARHRTAISSATTHDPLGTTINVALSEPASIQIVVVHELVGVRVGRRCGPRPRRRGMHRRLCVRLSTEATLQRHNRPAGMSAIAFSGRVGSRSLHPGAYRVLVRAWRGRLRSAAVSLPFIIVR
jgi:Carboxypeptidase regulatory-like domain